MTLNVSEIVTGDSVFDVMSVFMHIRIRRLSTFNIDNHLAWLYVLRRAPGGSIAFIDFNGRADSNVSEVSSPTELCFVFFFLFLAAPSSPGSLFGLFCATARTPGHFSCLAAVAQGCIEFSRWCRRNLAELHICSQPARL